MTTKEWSFVESVRNTHHEANRADDTLTIGWHSHSNSQQVHLLKGTRRQPCGMSSRLWSVLYWCEFLLSATLRNRSHKFVPRVILARHLYHALWFQPPQLCGIDRSYSIETWRAEGVRVLLRNTSNADQLTILELMRCASYIVAVSWAIAHEEILVIEHWHCAQFDQCFRSWIMLQLSTRIS